ncbi:hypothetical protein OAU80_01665 [Opitutales bacterium]|nr:hypothetical protein [Opitutales bacterium]
MHIIYTLFALSFFTLASCSREPTYSQAAKDKAMELLEAASTITSGTENGISYRDYNQAVDKFNSTLDMFLNFAPDDFNSGIKQFLIDAKASWVLTRKMWAEKIDRGAEDYYTSNMSYDKDTSPELWLAALAKDERGYPYFNSIGTTLGVGGVYFELAKPTLLNILE